MTLQPRPTPLPVRVEGIPETLMAERRWVVWRYEWRNGRDGKPGKWTKPPYIATATEHPADSTDAKTWRSFGEALSAYEDGKCDGVGFVLGDGWTGFDSDGTEAPEHVTLLNTFTERSPSGKGVHCLCRGTKPGPRCRVGNVELYDHGRYFTVTGHHVAGTPMTVEERTATLAVLYAQLFPNDDSEARPAIDAQHLRLSDDEVIERAHRAVNGDKLQRLWSGNLSDHGMDHSRADLALCCLLAYHTNDPVQIDRLFRQSGLMREKWDRQDYRVRTLARAVALAMSASIPDGVMPGPGVNVTAAQLNADWTGDF